MLSLEKAASPPAPSTIRIRRTIGRRVSAKESRARTISCPAGLGNTRRSSRRRRQCVVEEERPVRGDLFARLQAVENLSETVLLEADLDGALDEAAAAGADPGRHRAIALPDDAAEGHCHRSHGL